MSFRLTLFLCCQEQLRGPANIQQPEGGGHRNAARSWQACPHPHQGGLLRALEVPILSFLYICFSFSFLFFSFLVLSLVIFPSLSWRLKLKLYAEAVLQNRPSFCPPLQSTNSTRLLCTNLGSGWLKKAGSIIPSWKGRGCLTRVRERNTRR